MNYFGSYRRLLSNSKAAIVAAIEIYNKPVFSYRDESSIILVLNAWELLLKSILSRGKKSIYYPKKREQAYRTLSWNDALRRAENANLWPDGLGARPIEANLRHRG